MSAVMGEPILEPEFMVARVLGAAPSLGRDEGGSVLLSEIRHWLEVEQVPADEVEAMHGLFRAYNSTTRRLRHERDERAREERERR